ncbi:MAG: DNA internalization-related competence protein ComEC/Rec2 [Coriobacteriales bacterium]|nr:DNA internalization-related competence protein ComEC/Rec2 [Coriobacteriales bacterium]
MTVSENTPMVSLSESIKENHLERPSLSPVLIMLICSWTCIVYVQEAYFDTQAELLWAGTEALSLYKCITCILLILSFLGFAFAQRLRPFFILCFMGILLGSQFGWLFACSTDESQNVICALPVSAYYFMVESDPALNSFGSSYRFEASCFYEDTHIGNVIVQIPVSAAEVQNIPSLGDVISGVGTWHQQNIEKSYEKNLILRGISAQANLKTFRIVDKQKGLIGTIRSFRAMALELIGARENAQRALCAGVTLGMQSALNPFDLKTDFSELGLSHLIAVSGSHLALVASLLMSVLNALHIKAAPRRCIQACVLVFYVILTGFQASAIRSFAMVCIGLLAASFGRRSHGISSVSCAALILIYTEPGYAASLGFKLSVLSVLGITVFGQFVRSWICALFPKHAPYALTSMVSLTLVSQFATIPLTVPAFGNMSVISPLANILIGPLVSLLLIISLITIPVLFCFGTSGAFALCIPDALSSLIHAISSFLITCKFGSLFVDIPQAWLVGLGVLSALLLYFFWPKPNRAFITSFVILIVVICCILWISFRWFGPTRVSVLDIGQGDAILIQDTSQTVLVDTGPDDSILAALQRNHIVHLDAVVITHTDSDHLGGLPSLIRHGYVNHVLVATGVAKDFWSVPCLAGARPIDIKEITRGDIIAINKFYANVLWPWTSVSGDENEDSLVIGLVREFDSGESFEILLTGDAESEIITRILAAHLFEEADVYKAGHHGSKNSITTDILRELNTLVVVASAGENNKFGHPSLECQNAASQQGALFLCTIDHGDISFYPTENGIIIKTEK